MNDDFCSSPRYLLNVNAYDTKSALDENLFCCTSVVSFNKYIGYGHQRQKNMVLKEKNKQNQWKCGKSWLQKDFCLLNYKNETWKRK